MTNAETYTQNFARYAETRRELGKSNKGGIFDALAALNITEVLVEFNGDPTHSPPSALKSPLVRTLGCRRLSGHNAIENRYARTLTTTRSLTLS